MSQLYYGAVKNTRSKWLDLDRFCKLMLPRNDVRQIRYFTALVDVSPQNPGGQFRQKTFLRALATLPNLSIHRGHFLSHPVRLPLANAPTNGPRLVEVIKVEEKGSDVNLATYLLTDGSEDLYDVAVIVSNDSDLLEPIKVVRQKLRKIVGVINPHKDHRSVELRNNCDFYKEVRRSVLERSQLPLKITDRKGTFEKPAVW